MTAAVASDPLSWGTDYPMHLRGTYLWLLHVEHTSPSWEEGLVGITVPLVTDEDRLGEVVT